MEELRIVWIAFKITAITTLVIAILYYIFSWIFKNDTSELKEYKSGYNMFAGRSYNELKFKNSFEIFYIMLRYDIICICKIIKWIFKMIGKFFGLIINLFTKKDN